MVIDYRWDDTETARRANTFLQSIFVESSVEYGLLIPGTSTKVNRITLPDEEEARATKILSAARLLPEVAELA